MKPAAPRRRVPKAPMNTNAPGQLKGAPQSARAFTPNRTGALPTGSLFPSHVSPPISDLWRGRVTRGYTRPPKP